MFYPSGIYMVRHYFYDGYARHDQSDVKFFWDYSDAMQFLKNLELSGHFDDYEWAHWDSLDDMVFLKREGLYGYDYYYIQFIAPEEDIDYC